MSPLVPIKRQTLLRIARAADALEGWMAKNTGHNDEWLIEIVAHDIESANQFTTRINELQDALKPWRDGA
jgi:hypothetical protein